MVMVEMCLGEQREALLAPDDSQYIFFVGRDLGVCFVPTV